MSMTLEDLRDEWAGQSRRLDERLRIASGVLRDEWIERHRERVRRASQFGAFNMAVWIATLAMLGYFMVGHSGEPALFATALLIDAWVIATGVAGLRQRFAMEKLDYSQPLVRLQAQVEALRVARIRTFNWAFLTGQIVWWIPFVVVLFAALTGFDLYSSSHFVTFAAWNVAAGLAFIPLAIGLARRYGERLSKTTAVRHIADSIAGRDIAEARAYLEKLRRFDAESA
ncbi:MAG TPA: hypothetical protein VKR38_10605 [Usitatibacter sp.]|nr:hypothetical protein [Usitatibacter sp.]